MTGARTPVPRHVWMLVALLLGAVAGSLLHPYADVPALQFAYAQVLKPIGQLFLALLFMTVVPLVGSALVLGVWELGQGHGLGRTAARTLGWTVVASGISVLIGVAVVQVIQPGLHASIDLSVVAKQQGAVQAAQQQLAKSTGIGETFVAMIPRNPLDSAAKALQGEMLPFMVFALLFGLALVVARRGRSSQLVAVLEEVLEASMALVDFALRLAPLGVFCIVFGTLFQHGVGVLVAVGRFVLTVLLGLGLQALVVYPLLLWFGAKRHPLKFFSGSREVLVQAFSTASSNATLPTALRVAETRLGITPRIARFVLTVGATANQNGTALFEGVTVLFLAQV